MLIWPGIVVVGVEAANLFGEEFLAGLGAGACQVVETQHYQCAQCGAEVWTTDGAPVEWSPPPDGKRFEDVENPLICTGCQSRWNYRQ